MKKEVISFKDFLTFTNETNNSNSVDENFDDLDTSEVKKDSSILNEDRLNYLINDFDLSEEEINKIKSLDESDETEIEFYKLYRDINESFTCDIFIEGANPEKSKARLVLESDEWNLVFNGEISNGKCIIPIKKLDILKENLKGNIKLEIIAEGNVFIPWENKFLVKSSKKISTFNERLEKKIDVRVDKIK
jgi:hypothetical protein